MSKRSRASKRRLNNLLMILLLTAVLLVMSTYAWFTANRTVNIDSLDVTVATSSGLQISADGITWKTILDKDDIINAHDNYTGVINQMPKLMAPVSTALTVDTNGHLEMFYGKVSTDLTGDAATNPTYGHYILESELQTDKATDSVAVQDLLNGTNNGGQNPDSAKNEYGAGYYMAFDIFLRDDTAEKNLYMSGSVIEDIPEGGTAKQLENAARIALIKGGNYSNADDSTNVQNLTTVGGKAVLWEPNNDCHSQHGVTNADNYGITTSTGPNASVLSYDGIKAAYTTANAKVELYEASQANYSDYFKTITPTWTTIKSGVPSLKMPTALQDADGNDLSAGATKYRVYLWVEGQDVDCENYASGTGLLYNLSFSLDPY